MIFVNKCEILYIRNNYILNACAHDAVLNITLSIHFLIPFCSLKIENGKRKIDYFPKDHFTQKIKKKKLLKNLSFYEYIFYTNLHNKPRTLLNDIAYCSNNKKNNRLLRHDLNFVFYVFFVIFFIFFMVLYPFFC